MLRNRIYYGAKPFIPQRLRMAVRRQLAMRRRPKVADVWPIMPGSERPPEAWSGWPENKKFAVVLTHDVEGQRGLDKCRALMKLERELGFRSSFNFIPQGNYKVPAALREELTGNGFEVGVHDLKHDGRLFRSAAAFRSRAPSINKYLRDWDAVGFRSGFMLHNLDWLHELDIEYDMSTFDTDPFEPQPEGRNTIFPFWVARPLAADDRQQTTDDRRQSSVLPPPSSDFSIGKPGLASGCVTAASQPLSVSAGQHFSISESQRFSLSAGYVELPYTLPQDSTLFLLLGETTADTWCRKLDWIAAHGGMVLLDTHPDYMSFEGSLRKGTEYPVDRYREFLSYLQSNYPDDYWLGLPRQVARHVLSDNAFDSQGASDVTSVPPPKGGRLNGRRAAVVLFSHYPADPRPRRAAEALAAEGAKVDIICLRDEPLTPARSTYGNINVYRVPFQRRRGGKLSYIGQYSAFLLVSSVYLAFRSVFRRYDLVHVHNMPDVLVFSAAVPKLLGAKVILDLHDPMPELMQTIFKLSANSKGVRMLKRLEKWSIAFADTVLTVNLACKQIYSRRSCSPQKITVVLNSPDDNVFQFQRRNGLPSGDIYSANGGNGQSAPCQTREASSDGDFVILYHGSLVRRNGFDLAVDALARVRKTIPGARLAVCGKRTAYFEGVMESAHQRGLGHGIDYLGVRDLNGIVEAIQNCDLGIIPNHRNIFTEINTPTRIFEYLALAKPVIAPQAPGIRDYFGEDDLIFFELGDADDLARKIEYAASHPADVEKTVERGQEIYLSHTWSRERERLLDAVGDLLSV